MADIDNITEKLASSTVEEKSKGKEVSFVGLGLTLNTEEDAADIVKAINDCPGMTTLRLEGNTVGIPAAKVIAKALESQPDFKIALWKDMFTGRDKTEIPQALSHLSNGIMVSQAKLVVLDLSDNAFGPRGLVGIQKLLESPACYTLEELHLNNNGLGITGAQLLSEALCNCYTNSCKNGTPMRLRIFVCGRNRLENKGAISMSKFLKQLGTLQSVAVPQNGIYHEGVKGLSDAFSANKNLKVINLEDNSLTKEGVVCITKALPHLKELQMLNLGDCLVRTDGAVCLATALESTCPDLRELNLGFNEIGIEGGEALACAMRNKEKLQTIILNGNNFGDEGCESIKKRFQIWNKADALGSLSEDEGEQDDDDDDHYDEEHDDDDQDEEDGESDYQDEDDTEKPTHQSPMSRIGPADFISNPTSETLVSLHKAKEDFSSLLPTNPTNADYINLFFKTSVIVKPEDTEAVAAACKYADDFLAKAYSLSEDIADFNNKFLAGIGLIKDEDKKSPCVIDISSVLLVLEHAVKQEYFDASTKKLLEFFLSRPLKYVTTSGKSNHKLMQALYQF